MSKTLAQEERLFPLELLKAGTTARVKHFASETIVHQRLEDLADEVEREATYPGEASIIGLIGPAGVGKSTLLRIIERRMRHRMKSEVEADRSRLSCLSVEAPGTGDAVFSWSAFDKRLLLAAEEPFIDSKVNYTRTIERRPDGTAEIRAKLTRGDLRLAVEDMLRYRRPPLLMIDEAANMFDVIGGKAYMNSLDSLKSLSNVSETTMVLFGAYDLVTPLGPQLSRRFRWVHFPRYNYDAEEDRLAFADALATMQAHMAVPRAPDLLPHVEDMYVASVGCVGLAHTYLRKALAAACDQNLKSVTWDLIEKFVDWKKVAEWNSAASVGERDLAPRGSLREARSIVLTSSRPLENPVVTEGELSQRKALRRPGQRGLHRDVVDADYALSR
jgi:AAA domain